jgi:hypothetical protein
MVNGGEFVSLIINEKYYCKLCGRSLAMGAEKLGALLGEGEMEVVRRRHAERHGLQLIAELLSEADGLTRLMAQHEPALSLDMREHAGVVRDRLQMLIGYGIWRP